MYLLIGSIFPVIIFLYVIYQKDHHREPYKLLLFCLLGGCASVILSLLVSIPVSFLSSNLNSPLFSSFNISFFQAAIPEELAKFVVLYVLIWKHKEFNQYYDGIVYAVFVSLGFALIENILYVYNYGAGVIVPRALLAVPGHGLFAVLMGYYFSLARFQTKPLRNKYLLLSLTLPIVFHGLYDFVLFYIKLGAAKGLLLSLLLGFFAWVVIKLWRMGIYKITKHLKNDHINLQNI
jgi:RsiW-degrading membrane proteinase PrsW (M82 family)